MQDPLPEELAAPLGRLLARARRDPELAAAIRDVAQAVLALLPTGSEVALESSPPVAAAYPEAAYPEIARPEVIQPEIAHPEDIARLLAGFGRAAAPPNDAPPPTWDALPDFDPEAVAGNLRLKAETCRWLAEHGYTADRAALLERFRLIDLGRARDCHLWMLDPKAVNPEASSLHAHLSELFDLTAEALGLWQACEGEPEETDAARLLAAAQRALHAAVTTARGPGPELQDRDQYAVFAELRAFAKLAGVYLEALKLEATPLLPAELAERLQKLRVRREARQGSQRDRDRHLRRLTYHATLLQRGSHHPQHDRDKVLGALRDLSAGGLPESSPLLDAPLRPILLELDKLDDPLVQRVASYIAARRDVAAPPRATKEAYDAEVAQLAQLVGGRTVLMIGGSPRPETQTKLERALGCHLDWLESRPHQSHYTFEAAIARPEVALVLLLIRWSSHGFAEIVHFCREHRKPLVRLPSGYGVNTLARAVLGQASQQLAAG